MIKNNKQNSIGTIIFCAQILSLSLIWIFVIGFSVFIIHLLLLSIELKDVPSASMGICLVALPIFWTLAGILTYTFVGLIRNQTAD